MYGGLTFQGQYELAQKLCQDTVNADVKTFLKQQVNIGNKMLITELGEVLNEKERIIPTTVGGFSYQLPEDFLRLTQLYVTVGSNQYKAEEIANDDLWRDLYRAGSNFSSDYLEFVFRRRNTFEIYPPAATVNNMTLVYEPIEADLTEDDYTAGTITTLANGGTTVTGSGTTWTSAMVGRYLKIDSNNVWYEIASVASTTSLTLVKKYQGLAISAGTEAHTIGQMCRLPGPTHHISAYFSAWQYYDSFRLDAVKATRFEGMFNRYKEWAKTYFNQPISSNYIPPRHHLTNMAGARRNPNWFISDIS